MFVVFEGIDGSGKTSISNRVAAALEADGVRVKHLREAGKFASPISERLREFGRNAQNLELSWQAEFLLYVARDVQLIHEVLRPALQGDALVLADRFLYTPEVLGRYGRHLPESFLQPILTAAAEGLTPDLVILIDVDPTLARARRKLRKLTEADAKPPGRKGLSGAGLSQRLRRGYLERARTEPERWVVLENDDTLEHGVGRALELIRSALREGTARALARFRATAAPKLATAAAPRDPEQALSRFLEIVDGLAEGEPSVAAYLLGGMHGAVVDQRRRELLPRAPDAVLMALEGLGDDVSFELRERAAEEHPARVLRSLGLALSTPLGWQLWRRLGPRAVEAALDCLTGRDEEEAWTLREACLAQKPELRALVVATLAGLDGARAAQLRERVLALSGPELAQDYELCRGLARSVTGLGDARAWELRRLARPLAPVAALGSLCGLFDEPSWQWRRESLVHAPKIVMATLRGSDAEAAWELRRQVVADCKEALDGFAGVDVEPAWQLREQNLDRWPSTVVKSLAKLADAPRGRALVERQLQAFPENLSLLKHIARIALGLHRAVPAFGLRFPPENS